MNSDTIPSPPHPDCQDDITIVDCADQDSIDFFEAASRRADARHAAIEHNARGTCCTVCAWAIQQDRARVGEGL